MTVLKEGAGLQLMAEPRAFTLDAAPLQIQAEDYCSHTLPARQEALALSHPRPALDSSGLSFSSPWSHVLFSPAFDCLKIKENFEKTCMHHELALLKYKLLRY